MVINTLPPVDYPFVEGMLSGTDDQVALGAPLVCFSPVLGMQTAMVYEKQGRLGGTLSQCIDYHALSRAPTLTTKTKTKEAI